ncbi:hypothetical protein KSZ_44150 [Dictyobacter formicarum]|uniref:Uncharacterized protein n=1 Tax=Dictyobacter formicarum TaxID=2778368 RepID=A0ABQ3VL44_9CHLR|nr:hypothetical protein KSZ_44150 [Dictyobacter formicarum]
MLAIKPRIRVHLRIRVRIRRCTRIRNLSSNKSKNELLMPQKAFYQSASVCYNARAYASFIVESARIRVRVHLRIRTF